MGFVSRLLGNAFLEHLFLGSSKARIRATLSDWPMKKSIDLESIDLSVLSVEALNCLLLSESVSIGSEDALLDLILRLGSDYQGLLRHIQIGFLSMDGLSLLEKHFSIPPESMWCCAVESILHLPSPLNSFIISDFPKIFAQFRRRRFLLLWRGSRDGFGASEFHRRCDGHANTLTLILDTKGNVFGGFTPVEWESQTSFPYYKADDSLTSFLFTLKNPHNIPARRFALKAKKKHRAIWSDSGWGPDLCGIHVSDNCNANTDSCTCLGASYTNDTELGENAFFTGSEKFKVKEIEVFEITD
jgi:hypothetical protein